jgi:hypothetical protein
MLRSWGMDPQHAPWWADNMAKCSCWMCSAPRRKDDQFDYIAAAKEWE